MRAFDYKVLPTTYEIIRQSTEEASHIMTEIGNLLSQSTSMLLYTPIRMIVFCALKLMPVNCYVLNLNETFYKAELPKNSHPTCSHVPNIIAI